MKRRDFLQVAGGVLTGAALSGPSVAAPAKRPNIVWISCEDISPHLGCYGDAEARTPNLDRLASAGGRYTNAFSVSGVCAPSRSGIITGMYPGSLGTCHMRCGNPPPAHVKCFPEYLRNAGYYCTNRRKTDYNFPVPAAAWDECGNKAHYRNRPNKDQPFFAVFNFTLTHESKTGEIRPMSPEHKRVLLPDKRHSPAAADLPPYYPDTEIIRKHWAYYYDLVTLMDWEAGRILDGLKQDGLADDTIVFFFSDHGVGFPRAKRWLYDSGMHVPLIVRWPGNIEPGSVTDRLVSFADFAPTVLSLAGVPVPEHMQGGAFLGDAATPARDYVYAGRDRMDERYDIIRAVRDKRFKYIRNYEPGRPYAQFLEYCEGWAVMRDMRRVQAAGELKGPETLFFRETKPLEELYDVAADPHEIGNLAESPEHQAVLARMRKAIDDWMRDIKDLGLVPEMELDDWLPSRGTRAPRGPASPYEPIPGEAPSVFGRDANAWIDDLNGSDPYARLRAIAALGLADSKVSPVLVKALDDSESAVAYWAATGLANTGAAVSEIKVALTKMLGHASVAARLSAARTLQRLGGDAAALDVVLAAMKDGNSHARLFAVQILEETGADQDAVRAALEKALEDDVKYIVRVAEHALGNV